MSSNEIVDIKVAPVSKGENITYQINNIQQKVMVDEWMNVTKYTIVHTRNERKQLRSEQIYLV